VLQVRVVEVEAGSGVRVGGDRDHPCGRGRRQLRHQQVRQQERRQVVDREDMLEAVRGDPALVQHQAGVVDEHVDTLQRGQAPG
jgi:hypothetical protein